MSSTQIRMATMVTPISNHLIRIRKQSPDVVQQEIFLARHKLAIFAFNVFADGAICYVLRYGRMYSSNAAVNAAWPRIVTKLTLMDIRDGVFNPDSIPDVGLIHPFKAYGDTQTRYSRLSLSQDAISLLLEYAEIMYREYLKWCGILKTER